MEASFPGLTLEGSGSVEVAPTALCEAARAILGDALRVPFSCTGGGTVALLHPSPDPVSLMALFVRTVERIGGTVQIGQGGSVVVTGPLDGAPAATGVEGSLGAAPSLDGLNAFVLDDASPQTFTEAATLAGYQRNGLIRPLRDAMDGDNARSLAAELGLDLRVVQLGGAGFVVGDEVSLATFDAFSGLSERVVVPIAASGLSAPALAAYQASFSAVGFDHDPASGTVYVSGLPNEVAVAVAALRQVQPATSRVRIEGLFVAYDTGDLRSLETELSLAAAPFDLDRSALGVSNGATLGLPFEVVVAHVERANFVQVVARPAVTATFGLPAEFRSGGEVPVIGGRDPETGAETVEYRSVGLTTQFTATPLMGDLVRLDLRIEVSSVAGAGVLDSPAFDVRSVSTVVDLRRGDTVLLSGLSELSRSSSRASSFGFPSSAGSRQDRSLGLFVTLR